MQPYPRAVLLRSSDQFVLEGSASVVQPYWCIGGFDGNGSPGNQVRVHGSLFVCSLAIYGREYRASMKGGSVDEFLGVAIERPALDHLQVEVGRSLEDRLDSGFAGDDREDCHAYEINESGGHQRPV